MKIKLFIMGAYQENCYVVFCEKTGKAFIVDPGYFNVQLADYIEENKLDIQFIILTHAHGDHIGGVEEAKQKFDAPVYIHKEEASILRNAEKNASIHIWGRKISIEPDRLLKDGEVIEVGEMNLKIIHTPGHSPGCICIYAGTVLFSGDTLFADSIGRTDFPESSTEAIIKSIKEKIYTLPEDTQVFPGHGPSTTIGYEKKHNYFVRAD
ncbi:MAG: MBL fold metallo-hydrolase [Clostridiales bacterium]|nr:MBL fold metallo-hydrolase [Clostridiales bacterium]